MVNRTLRLAGCSAFVLYVLYVARPGSSLFSWHPFLMTLAFTGLMTEAVFSFSKSALWSGEPHGSKVTKHWVLLAAAAVAHGLGYAAIYYTKEANDKPHLTSPHGCLGCLVSILLWVQLIGGVFSKYPKLLRSFLPLKTLRAGHSLSGSLIYAAGLVALIGGVTTVWYKNNACAWSIPLAIGFHVMLLFSVLKRHYVRYISSSK